MRQMVSNLIRKDLRLTFENVFHLVILQLANYLLPLLTTPYLARVLGPENFGKITFALTVVLYFSMLTDYGFNLSATRQIALNNDNKQKLNQIFSSVIIIKFAIFLLSLVMLTILIVSFEMFRIEMYLYLSLFTLVLGQVLFPTWFFQGMQKMKYITYINLVSKAIFTFFIFYFVQDRSDYLLVAYFTAGGYLLSGIIATYFVFSDYKIKFSWQNLDVLRFHLLEGWHVFFSGISISLYAMSSTIFIGLFSNNAAVANFAVADKIIQAIKALYSPFSQSFFPLISTKVAAKDDETLQIVYKIIFLIGFVMFGVSTLLFMFADQIIMVLFGAQYVASGVYLKIMAWLPFVVFLSNVFGVQTMLNFDRKRAFGVILFCSAVLGLVLSSILIKFFSALGAAISILCIEIFVTVSMWYYVQSRLKLFRLNFITRFRR